VRKTFKYRLYPSRKQVEFLTGQLQEACRLYNGALQERRDAYRISGESMRFFSKPLAGAPSLASDG
jgi:putative transposase